MREVHPLDFTGTLPPDPATSLSVLTFVVRIR
jgi:hypothetical protein